jgi:polysaccharide export outer membrane protein
VLFKTKKKINTTDPVLIVDHVLKDSVSTSAYRHRIKVGDRIAIRFLNNYDIGERASQSATSGASSQSGMGDERGYLVNFDSTCTLPLVGRINLVGLTRLEAGKKLEEEYSKYVIKPIIDVNIVSLSVIVLGEVNIPGKIRIDKENTTLIDVIALAGGLKDAGKKRNIKLIRKDELIIVNLEKIESVKSPDIIVHDNDIIYVEPYGIKAATEPTSALLPIATLTLTFTQLIVITVQIYGLLNK